MHHVSALPGPSARVLRHAALHPRRAPAGLAVMLCRAGVELGPWDVTRRGHLGGGLLAGQLRGQVSKCGSAAYGSRMARVGAVGHP